MQPQSPQDRSAQTRIQNDQQRAQNAQMASQSVKSSLSKPGVAGGPHFQSRGPQQMNPVRPTGGIPQSFKSGGPNGGMGPGPQPVGELGNFIKSMAQQQQMQQAPELMAGGGSPDMEAKQGIEMEEFLQSPALQEAITRTKLTQYFKGRGKSSSPDHASAVLANLSRYQ